MSKKSYKSLLKCPACGVRLYEDNIDFVCVYSQDVKMPFDEKGRTDIVEGNLHYQDGYYACVNCGERIDFCDLDKIIGIYNRKVIRGSK